MSNENETNILQDDKDTIEEKRRKNVMDNQKFLEGLKLFNVRDDLKSTVNSVTTVHKPSRKKPKRKENIDQSEIRRSSRIQSMPRTNYNNQSTLDDENLILSTDDTSNEEEEDDLTTAFTAKIDTDWKPSHPEKQPMIKNPYPVRKTTRTASGGVKIFMPNTGLQASIVLSKDNSHKTHVSKKMNVAISSSSEED